LRLDPDLFGNDAAEDEAEDVFNSYVIKRSELDSFRDQATKIRIARAYKGEGKSALLRLTKQELVQRSEQSPLIVHVKAANLSPSLTDTDPSVWVRAWKQAILSRLASEIGQRIGFAWTDDAMSLVEEAERQGFKSRNIVTAILERLRVSVEHSAAGAKVNVQANKPSVSNPEAVVRRWTEGKECLWFLIDDVDENFEDTALWRVKVASFFSACRDLVNNVPELRIRGAVRPNVWTTISLTFEDLSKVEQYVVDLSWSMEQIRKMLAHRVEGYLKRRFSSQELGQTLKGSGEHRDLALISLVFVSEMPWGKGFRPPHVILYTLSKHRPRWVIELCRAAAAQAADRAHTKISKDDITEKLHEFGQRRVRDTIAEFRSQCPQIEELITAFNRSKEQMTTDELLGLINSKIIGTSINPKIAGAIGKASSRDIASFLFEIGLFFARRDNSDGSYDHITFAERPALLRARTDIDAGMKWEIHPVFRQYLEIRDSTGREQTREREAAKGQALSRSQPTNEVRFIM
jgi:hypothetical protein